MTKKKAAIIFLNVGGIIYFIFIPVLIGLLIFLLNYCKSANLRVYQYVVFFSFIFMICVLLAAGIICMVISKKISSARTKEEAVQYAIACLICGAFIPALLIFSSYHTDYPNHRKKSKTPPKPLDN